MKPTELSGFVADSKKGATGMGVPGAGGGQAAQDPINALQNLARQGKLLVSIYIWRAIHVESPLERLP